jgi:diaminopimelate epimerase
MEADEGGRVRFEKWQALGNDYLIVEADALRWDLTPERIRRICRPHLGVGSDGILLLSRSTSPAHVAELRVFNPDGSEAELSGNGAREAVLYLRASGWTDEDEFSILTKAGEIRPTITGPNTATLEMGTASVTSADFPSGDPSGAGKLTAGGREWRFQHVSIGNPQCVIDVGDEVEELDLSSVGPEIEHSPLFPNRTNTSFIRVDGSTVRARIFERGVGETLSSGTGASGAAVAAFLGGATSPITVSLDGGELKVEITGDLEVRLTGTAERVFSGELSADLERELEGA